MQCIAGHIVKCLVQECTHLILVFEKTGHRIDDYLRHFLSLIKFLRTKKANRRRFQNFILLLSFLRVKQSVIYGKLSLSWMKEHVMETTRKRDQHLHNLIHYGSSQLVRYVTLLTDDLVLHDSKWMIMKPVNSCCHCASVEHL